MRNEEVSAAQSAARTKSLGGDQPKNEYPKFTAESTMRASFREDAKMVHVYQHIDVDVPKQCGGTDCVDGNTATAHAAYALTEAAFIYPITPSSVMGEVIDAQAAAGKLNCFGQKVSLTEMQAEGGAAGALHGALSAGVLGSTFTASQGLLLMIPNMYKIAGEFLPCVIHVTARTLATHALSIYGDHGDINACRGTGWTMLCSESVQMAHDFALLSHFATIESRVPILHFFDGFRTSHEVQDVQLVDYSKLNGLIPHDMIAKHRALALSPMHPHLQGQAQGPDVYFQCAEAANVRNAAVTQILSKWADKVGEVIGRKYAFFGYNGAADAEDVVVVMGSGAVTTVQAVNQLVSEGRKVGVISVRLLRPWSAEMFCDALPATVKRLCILDRSKDTTALAEPLYLDVAASIVSSGRTGIQLLGGRYGLSSKDYTPGMALSVFENMSLPQPKLKFTVGINDDVTHLSLPLRDEVDMLPAGTKQCLFYGLGSDGTVGANKTAIKLISHNTKLHTQAYFEYDAKKSGGATISHLRFGPEQIRAPYRITHADYIGIHRHTYLHKYNMLRRLKQGGTVVINCSWVTPEEIERELPASFKRQLAAKQGKLYVIDADKVAGVTGMGKRINMIMQTAFFKVADVITFEEASRLLQEDVHKVYGKKDEVVIKNNIQAIDLAGSSVVAVPYDAAKWAALEDEAPAPKVVGPAASRNPKLREYIKNIADPMNSLEGDSLPVSAFEAGGRHLLGATEAEKRQIALKVPLVDMQKCTQCNYCSFICPHAAVRPFLLTEKEVADGPEGLRGVVSPAQGGGALDKYKFRVQVSPMDCTGCELCVRICPSNALKLVPAKDAIEKEADNWNYCAALPNRGSEVDPSTVKGSQFQQPMLQFSGACEGCGETPYVKLLTQLFGNRLVISNATGCSSIWGGMMPSIPLHHQRAWRGPSMGQLALRGQRRVRVGHATRLQASPQCVPAGGG